MDRSRVGIVIPALNESKTIGAVVGEAKLYGVPIVVDDGSTDDTAKLASQAGAIVVLHESNRGYDAALNSGFKKAADIDCEIIVTMDADGQHDPSLVDKYIQLIEQGADIVIGVRSIRQRLAEHIFSWYTKYRFQIKDPLCGMKVYKTSVYRKLGYFDSYGSVGTELMMFAAVKGYRIEQLEFKNRERQGQSRFGNSISANYKILKAMIYSIFLL